MGPDAFPPLSETGFCGGRNGLRAFCETAFRPGAPRCYRTEAGGLAIFRHADLRAFAARPEIGNVPGGVVAAQLAETGARLGGALRDGAPPLGSGLSNLLSNQFFFNNPPLHGPLRRALLSRVGPKAAPALAASARDIAREVVDRLGDRIRIDLFADLAEPMVVGFWGAFVGLDSEAAADFAPCVRALTDLFRIGRTAETMAAVDAACRAYAGRVEAAALRSLAAGAAPHIAALAADLAEVDDPGDPDVAGLKPPNVGAFLAGNLLQAFHTAGVGAANALLVLAREPAARARLEAGPRELDRIIAEALRLEPPVIMLGRYALADTVIDGIAVPKGSGIEMIWGAGALDPEAFLDPLVFDPDRSGPPSTVFGGGAHICPGRFSVAMLIRVLFEALEAAGVRLEPEAGPAAWLDAHMLSQLAEAPAHRLR